MGRVKTKVVKRAAEKIVEKYYSNLGNDFHNNKLVVVDVADIQTKRLRNQVAGYVTRLYNRVRKGGARKIFIKKHEEERQRKESMVAANAIMDQDKVVVDNVTMRMLMQYCYYDNSYVAERQAGDEE